MFFLSIGLPILALAGACGLFKFVTRNKRTLSEPRAQRLTIGVQIICGDCSGEGETPFKTYLDRTGNCAQCGGRSFMLASSRIVYAQQQMVSCLSDHQRDERSQPQTQTNLYDVRARTLTA